MMHTNITWIIRIYRNVSRGLKAKCKLLSLSDLTNLVYMVYKTLFSPDLGGFYIKEIKATLFK